MLLFTVKGRTNEVTQGSNIPWDIHLTINTLASAPSTSETGTSQDQSTDAKTSKPTGALPAHADRTCGNPDGGEHTGRKQPSQLPTWAHVSWPTGSLEG